MSESMMGLYALEALLARGAMGEVWRARHPTLDRDVAVKVLRAELGDRADLREGFAREVRVLSRLRSPHTVQVQDAGVGLDGRPYFVTELLTGEDLGARLERLGALPWPEAAGIAIDVLKALAEAHALGMVHRDIKPANVFLQALPGGQSVVKVLDFGVAKVLDTLEGAEETVVGIKGSPRYMAPEQVLGGPVTPQSDLYGLGCTLYRMLSGEPVFSTEGREAQLRAQVNDAPMPLANRCPLHAVPEALDALVLACLEKAPERRPASAEALIRSLQALMGVPEPDALGGLGVVPPSAGGARVQTNARAEALEVSATVARGVAVHATEAPLELAVDPQAVNDKHRKHWAADQAKAGARHPGALGPRGVDDHFTARRSQSSGWGKIAWVALVLVGMGTVWTLSGTSTSAPQVAPASVPATTADAPTPAVVKRIAGDSPAAPDAPVKSALLGISRGTATFANAASGQPYCVDAVECPVPLETRVRIFRPGGASRIEPGVSQDRARAGIVLVELP